MLKRGWGGVSTSRRAWWPVQSPLIEAAALSFFLDNALWCDPVKGAVLWILIHHP
jgi:hypothetical protein